MAEPAQFAEDVEVPEEEGAFAGLPQSTPVKSRFRHDQLMMVLTSPPETGPRTKPFTSGTYIAKPPTWSTAQVSITIYSTCLNEKLKCLHSHSIV